MKKEKNTGSLWLKCESCGAGLEIVDKGHAFCRYCGKRYLLDEAQGRVTLDVNITYRGNGVQGHRALKTLIVVLLIFLVIAIGMIKVIWDRNVPARESELMNPRGEAEWVDNDEVLVLFCEEVFGKKYKDITKEEFASIRYISWEFHARQDATELYYSFVDYKDCASEEEFQKTIQCWAGVNMHLPMDFTMFTGLTRIDNFTAVMTFSKEAKISYLCTNDALHYVRESLNPATVEVLHLEINSSNVEMEGLEEYTSLKELYLSGFTSESLDMKQLLAGKDLETLWIESDVGGYENPEVLGKKVHLKRLYLNYPGSIAYDFWKNLKDLEVLHLKMEEEVSYSMLEELPNLKEFCTNKGCLSARELSVLPEIEVLNIAIDTPQALEALSKCSKLRSLSLELEDTKGNGWNKDAVDISCLGGLVRLEWLSIYGCTVTGVEPLYNHPRLEGLLLGKNQVDPGQLKRNDRIKTISLAGNSVVDVTTGEAISEKDFLKLFPNVEDVNLRKCQLTNVSFLTEYPNLRICNLQSNKIVDFSPLNACKKLEKVYVYDNPYEELPFSEEVKVVKGYVELED